jgi:hypothetical protein
MSISKTRISRNEFEQGWSATMLPEARKRSLQKSLHAAFVEEAWACLPLRASEN